MKKFDYHGILGLAGVGFTAVCHMWSDVVTALAGTATAAYMTVRFFREWRKYRHDSITVKTTTTTKTHLPS